MRQSLYNFIFILEYLTQLQNLKELDIVCSLDTFEAKSLSNMKNVETLKLSAKDFSNTNLFTLFNKPKSNLIDLSISGWMDGYADGVDENVLKAIAKNCPNLKNLSVTVTGLTGTLEFHNLKTLKLFQGSKDFIAIFENENLKELLKLEIEKIPQINDVDLETIGNFASFKV